MIIIIPRRWKQIYTTTIPAIDRRRRRMFNPYAKRKEPDTTSNSPRRQDVKMHRPRDVKQTKKHQVKERVEKPSLIKNRLLSSSITYNVENNSEWTPKRSQGQKRWKRNRLKEIREVRQILKRY